MNSACAHQTYPTKKVTLKDANNIKAGSLKESNDRVIHQLIIDGVAGVRTCQLQMGVTELKEGSVWNTMPAHTHLRRMETCLLYTSLNNKTMTYTIEKVTTLIGARRYGDNDTNIGFILTDSRSLCFPEETLFFALKSERNDGHNYICLLYTSRGETSWVSN